MKARQVFPVVPIEEWPADLRERSAELARMTLAEAGYPAELEPFDNNFLVPAWVPEDVLDQARILVFDHLGVEYEVRA